MIQKKSASRANKALKNSVTSIICQLVGIVVSFASRTVFTQLLGSEYLGVSGLFTNILTILSFAELGFGTAIVYRLYAPLAKKDYNTVNLYMRLYKKIYMVVTVIILVFGLSLIPFLHYLVEAPAVVEDVHLLYCLYLLHTAVSYICVYKKSLLIADQNDYIVSLLSQAVTIVMHITQIVFLLITHNFIVYCILLSAFALLENIVCSLYANKKYKYLGDKVEENLPKEEVFGLRKDLKGLMLTNVAATVLNGTDNIFISSFIGISYVGILSNYSLILTTVNGVMNRVFSSLTATIGNLVVEGDNDQTEDVLKKMYFLNAAIYCFICTGMILLIKEFVSTIWLNEEYILPDFTITVAIIELLFRSLHYPIHTTQMAMGLFSQYRIMYAIAAVLNIILDFALVKPLGVAGLILATIFCRWIIFFTDIYVVYHIGFNKNMMPYILMIGKWLLFMIINVFVSKVAVSFIAGAGIGWFAVRVCIITVIYGILFLVTYSRSEDFKYYMQLAKRILNRKKSK